MKIGRIARNVGLAWLTLLPGVPLCRAAVLYNDNIRVTISDTGSLESVENLLAAELAYTLPGHHGFFRRALRIVSPTPLRVNNLTLGNTVFSSPAREVVHDVTFIAAPTVEFV